MLSNSSKELDYKMIKWGLVRKGFTNLCDKVLWVLSKFGSR